MLSIYPYLPPLDFYCLCLDYIILTHVLSLSIYNAKFTGNAEKDALLLEM